MSSVRLVRVFVTYPADVAQEARLVDNIAQELNATMGGVHKVRMEVIRWERDVRAGVGSDAQEFVNGQLGADYEVLIGVFWSRVGSPTPRASSGSIEEIDIALRRFRNSQTLPLVMIYFKTAGIDPMNVEPGQLAMLRDLRNQLSDNGVLYKTFQDQVAFESLVRIDLARALQHVVLMSTGQNEAESAIEQPSKESGPNSEQGILDYLDAYEEAFRRLLLLVNAQAESLDQLAESNKAHAAEINARAAEGDRRLLRRLINRSSESWNGFADEAETRAAELESVVVSGFSALSSAISLDSSSDSAARLELADTLSSLASSVAGSRDSSMSLRNTVAATPRMTAEMNRAKHRMVSVLERWNSVLSKTESLASEISQSLREMT